MAGLDALFEGAFAGLVLVLPSVALFWWLTARLSSGPRVLRPAITCCAAYGAMAGAGALWAFNAQRPSVVDDALAGLLIMGALALVVAFLVLLLFPRKA